jgi:uncharacterized protein
MKWLKRILVSAAALALLAYAGIAGALYAQQRSILFRPDPTRVDPATAGFPKAREVNLGAPGTPTLIAWHVDVADPTKPFFLYLHGNAANIARRAARFEFLTRDGSGLLALSWRGYGGSEGMPSEAGFHEDVEKALAYLKEQGIGPERIVLFGESLGSGMAVMTAARTPVKALILDSPYLSIAAIAAERFWWLPVGLLIRDPFRADLAAPQVRAPVFAIHCTGDWVTPYEGGKQLLAKLAGPTRLVTVDRRCHVPSFSTYGAEQIAQFIEEINRGR